MWESRSPAFGRLVLADPRPLLSSAGLGWVSQALRGAERGVLSGAPQREPGGRTHPRTLCALVLPGGRLRLQPPGAAKR